MRSEFHANPWRLRLLLLTGLAMAASTLPAPQAAAKLHTHANPNILWHLVHDGCTPAARKHKYPPKPCVEVSAPAKHFERGYAVLKDIRGRSQYLVLPLARITGVGSPTLLKPNAPNYFADAWTARLYVDAALHRIMPRDELILAINSKYGRTQNQLHIHVDCIRSEVHNALREALPYITGQWKPLPVPLRRHIYVAKWFSGTFLAINPFRSLASALPAGAEMDEYGLAVAGAYSSSGKAGFILLATRADISKGNYGSAEELQDHACAIAHQLQTR